MEVTKDGRKSKIISKGKKFVYQYVSIINWLPKYTKFNAVSDIVAGFTVGLTLMPQSIAYASLAGLSAQYGLYSAFMGSFVYTIFGTIKEVSIGPTSLMALLTFQFTQDLPVEFVILLSFLAGCVEFLMGILNMGFLVDFISAPVTSGFTSATSIIIIVSQLKGILGISFKSQNFIDNVYQLFLHGSEARLWDTILGITCCIFLLSFRKITAIPLGPKDPELMTKNQRILKKTLWFISIARNAILVLICSVIAFKLHSNGSVPFILSGKIKSGLPDFKLPPFSAQVGNVTYSFPDMCKKLGSSIILVPIVAVLANVAIAKAFSSGASLNATQEMLTLGLCNLFGSFVQAFPTCGAFTRSAVSNASGVRTPMMGLYSGTIILLALSFLTPYFYFIPRATLSAVLICAVMFMIDWKIIIILWKSSKRDFFLLIISFTSCLAMGVEVGLLIGVACDITYLLYLWARPNIDIEKCKGPQGGEYLIVTPDLGLPFAAVDFIRVEVCKIGEGQGRGILPIVINCVHIKGIDFTTTTGFNLLLRDFKKREQPLIFFNLKPRDVDIINNADVKFLQYCNSEEELFKLLFGEKMELRLSETTPILEEEEKLIVQKQFRKYSENDLLPVHESIIMTNHVNDEQQ